MIQSFLRLQHVNIGLDAKNVITASVSLPRAKYRADEQRAAFFQTVNGTCARYTRRDKRQRDRHAAVEWTAVGRSLTGRGIFRAVGRDRRRRFNTRS
jgi:hypothetical protein